MAEGGTDTKEANEVTPPEETAPREKIMLHNGVVLRIRPIPPMLALTAAGHIKDPEPPLADIGKGRQEPNYADPEYMAALEALPARRAAHVMQIVMARGTEVESVPEGIFRPEEDGWVAELELLDVPLDLETAPKRYMAWLNNYACETVEDLQQITDLPFRLAGLNQQEVEAAARSFRDNGARGADNDGAAETPGPDRDND